MDFAAVCGFLFESFEKEHIRFALIGGLALHASGVTRTTEDVDFLIARRRYALAMLDRSIPLPVLGGRFTARVVAPEDLIGLKVQSSINDPSRADHDRADIRNLMRNNLKNLDLDRIKEYYALFGKEDEFSQLLAEMKRASNT